MKIPRDPNAFRNELVRRTNITEDGCWELNRSQSLHYPHVPSELKGSNTSLRRLVYGILVNDPPMGNFVVEATCKNCKCLNPSHLIRGYRNKGGRPRFWKKRLEKAMAEIARNPEAYYVEGN